MIHVFRNYKMRNLRIFQNSHILGVAKRNPLLLHEIE